MKIPASRRARLPLVLVIALLAWASMAPAAHAAPVQVLGTGVALEPPPGFVPAQRFTGFERDVKSASIVVTELEGPAPKMQKGMTREMLASRGMTLIRSQTVRVHGKSALLLQVSQVAAGTEFLKWMLVAGDTKKTVMIVGTFPKAANDLALPIKQAILSATWGGKVQAAPYEGLLFRADPTPVLKLAGRVGNALIFSESGSMTHGDPNQAILVMGNSSSAFSIANVEQFARDRATRSTQVGELRNIVGRALTVDGLPGYEIVAEANDARTGREVRMYQLVLVEQKTYYLAQGFVPADRARVILDQFRQVTGTFKRLRAPK
ncbi:MAG TPA: hypothetical protein VEU09_01845 [Candidatus Binatia bacterium]|nr:hypothetical protein [Candidatus Binatia bacterium]